MDSSLHKQEASACAPVEVSMEARDDEVPATHFEVLLEQLAEEHRREIAVLKASLDSRRLDEGPAKDIVSRAGFFNFKINQDNDELNLPVPRERSLQVERKQGSGFEVERKQGSGFEGASTDDIILEGLQANGQESGFEEGLQANGQESGLEEVPQESAAVSMYSSSAYLSESGRKCDGSDDESQPKLTSLLLSSGTAQAKVADDRNSTISRVTMVPPAEIATRRKSVGRGRCTTRSDSNYRATTVHELGKVMAPPLKLLPTWQVTDQELSRQAPAKLRRMVTADLHTKGRARKAVSQPCRHIAIHLEKDWYLWIIHPCARPKLLWELLGLSLLGFDVLWMPLQVFEPPENLILLALHWLAVIYWTLDIYVSVTSGYYTQRGDVVMEWSRICRRYFQTWFCYDFLVTSSTWLEFAVEEAAAAAPIQESGDGGLPLLRKMARILRVLRIMRLLRVAKFRTMMQDMKDRIVGHREGVAICHGLAMNVLCLMILNHVVACIWFLVGVNTGYPNWVDHYGVRDVSWLAQYITSIHWSWTQFTPASMRVFPQNDWERLFNVTLLFFSFVIFSSFVSAITTGMTRLRNLNSLSTSQLFLLRKFLKENHISRDLSARVTRYVAVVLDMRRHRTDSKQVDLLRLLSANLFNELHVDLFAQHIGHHPFFRQYKLVNSDALTSLCVNALKKTCFSKGDWVFDLFHEAKMMYFFLTGSLTYHRGVALASCAQNLDEPTVEVVKQNGQTDDNQVPRNSWFSEAALWTEWLHQGAMSATYETDLVTLDSVQFGNVTKNCSDVYKYSLRYAADYCERLLATPMDEMSDLPIDIPGLKDQDHTWEAAKHAVGMTYEHGGS
eukprot:TRINITY_DN7353_c0_g1_i3.p1 TRINITY_DN7353_c0_g1~~TRINITY_DN7353_c0_g1_i3.p1  ORF type:complete len:845 (-),score=122.19 TRINITY_DN7353_c0_g1_i3:110-2644(-)